MIDKTESIVKYLLQCPIILNSKFFFNFSTAKDKAKHLVTNATDIKVYKSYIDGSELKRYTFTLIDYTSVSYQPIVKQEGYPNENMEDMIDFQAFINWITEQNELRNFPDFGEDCVIDEIKAMTDIPNLNGLDSNSNPNLAKYSVVVSILYLDTSKVLFK